MKTKTIFKTLALATMMPAMLLTTACSSDDDAVNNGINNNGKGYALPVTINVTRGDGAATRATYNESTNKLEFSSGDQLFVKGTDGTVGAFAGTLEWQSGGTFSGTLYTANSYSGTAVALLTSASTATATLLPDGYGSIGYLSVSGEGYSATLATNASNAFATSKAEAVEQLSLEQASAYSSGFELAPQNAILNFTTANGLGYMPEMLTPYTVSLQAGGTNIIKSVTPVQVAANAVATFAMAVAGGTTPSLTLTVDGTAVSLGTHALTAGKIYNQKLLNIIEASPNIMAGEKWLVYGSGTGKQTIIPEGATVTLSNLNMSDASISCFGNATIILADGTENTITSTQRPAIWVKAGKTVTIKGTGTLNVTGKVGYPAIGPYDESCGDITIASTVHLNATAGAGYDKAITTNGGGKVTIGGVEYPEGTGTPFVYPVPAAKAAAEATAEDKGKLIGTDGKIYADVAAATAAGTTAVAKIIYLGTTGHSTYTHGLALALTDEASKMEWQDAINACSAKNTSTPVTNATWLLASKDQWNYMLDTNGAGSYTALRDGFSSVGGSNLQSDESARYWSSTVFDSTQAWRIYFYNGMWNFDYKDESRYVRACLAF